MNNRHVHITHGLRKYEYLSNIFYIVSSCTILVKYMLLLVYSVGISAIISCTVSDAFKNIEIRRDMQTWYNEDSGSISHVFVQLNIICSCAMVYFKGI